MARLRDKDAGGRASSPKDGYVQRLPETKKTLGQWLSEPGAKPALAVVAAFFFVVWGFCMFTGTVLSGFMGTRSSLATFLVGNVLFGILLLGWTVLGGSPKLMISEGGVLDVAFGMFKRTDPPLEFDEAPAQLARKRGNPEEALRLYREGLRALPHRLDLHYRIAETEHVDRKRLDDALRGYRSFLKRLDEADRPPTDVEADCAALARARLADFEKAEKEPPPRRVIQV